MKTVKPFAGLNIVSAADYNIEQLTDIYNQTRVDYLIPMPMNTRRMEEYIQWYDIDLNASSVLQIGDGLVVGLSMMGIRGHRAWITRLGIIPAKRYRGMGHHIMEAQIEIAREFGVSKIQLEVIKGNNPAYYLFQKLGFRDTRELAILRRPPTPLTVCPPSSEIEIKDMTSDEITTSLRYNFSTLSSSWLNEADSLLNMGNLKGYRTNSGKELIFRVAPLQITHLAFDDYARSDSQAMLALLAHLHRKYPKIDTKIENVAIDSLTRSVFTRLHYVEIFRRIEMVLSI